MGKIKNISIKDILVGNTLHGKNDVTCGGLLNEPEHKLSEKADKEYVNIKLNEVNTIDDVGGDITYEEPLYYPSVIQKGKKIKYNNQCYEVQKDNELVIDYSKLNAGLVQYNDILNLFNENGCYVPETAVEFISGEMYSDGFGLILPKVKESGTQNVYNLFDFNTFIDDDSLIVKSCEISYKTQKVTVSGETYTFTIQVNDILKGTQNIELSANEELTTTTIDTTWGFRNLSVIVSSENYSLIVTQIKLNLVHRLVSVADDEDFYVYKKSNLVIEDILDPSKDTRHKFYRNLVNEEIHFTEQIESKDSWEKITTTNELTDGNYLIVCESKTPYNVFNGSKTESFDKIDLTATILNDKILYVYKDDKTPIDDLTTICVYITKFYDSNDDKYYYNIKAASGDYYIGGTAKSKLTTGTTANYFKNDIQFIDNECNIISANYSGSGTLKLQRTSNGAYFRFYTSAQANLSLFKHIETNPYIWKTIAKKEEISKVGFSNNYNDLDNKPLLGDVIVNDYEILPSASIDYKNIIARYNNSLYTLALSNGWNFDPIRFSNEYGKTQSISKEQVRDYFYKYLKRSSEHFNLNNFDISKLNTQNTIGVGLQIGTSSVSGYFKINMLESTFKVHTYLFNSITIAVLPWTKSNGLAEAGTLTIKIGYAVDLDNTPTINNEKTITFEVDEEVLEKSITIRSENKCNYVEISTDETSGRRVILSKFIYNDLRYYVSDNEMYDINENYIWKAIGNENNRFYVKNKTLFL